MDDVARHIAKVLKKVRSVAVGTLVDGRQELAAFGEIEGSRSATGMCWEIGSITKVFTGILLAEMVERGEVTLDDPIGLYVPDGVASRLPPKDPQPTLRSLATHTSGLPRLPLKMVRAVGKSDDPYAGLDVDDVWAYLGPKTTAPKRRRHRYSNYGMGLLGHLLEGVAGVPYEELISGRILGPLGMSATGFGGCPGIESTVVGYRKGKPTPPWTFGALAAAGGLRSTLGDMLTLAEACIDPPDGALGRALENALGIHHRSRMQRIGLGWMHRVVPPNASLKAAVWHNGGTYGTASFLAIDREASRAVIVFGNRGPVLASPIDRLGWSIFDDLNRRQ